ncbi:MAG: hypothetical protein ACXVI5_06315 [Halobacteriota archaeon]
MDAALRQRLALFCILLIVGITIGAIIVALGTQKTIPGTSKNYVSVVKARSSELNPEQQSELRAKYEARLNSSVVIANKDDRVQQLLAEPHAQIVGIALPRGLSADDDINILVKVDSTFYKITMERTPESVTSVEECTCYGPGCNG